MGDSYVCGVENSQRLLRSGMGIMEEERERIREIQELYYHGMDSMLEVSPCLTPLDALHEVEILIHRFKWHLGEECIEQMHKGQHKLYTFLENHAVPQMWKDREELLQVAANLKGCDDKTHEEYTQMSHRLVSRMRQEHMSEALVFPARQQEALDMSKLLQKKFRVQVQDLDPQFQMYFLTQMINRLNVPLLQTVPLPIRSRLSRFRGAVARPFPVELQALIYSHVTLETAVSLRQVSYSWYRTFHYLCNVFEPAVRQRALGLVAENGYSWSDCVLIFVGRLKRSRVAKDVEKFTPLKTGIFPDPVPGQTIVAIETRQLPPDFESLLINSYGVFDLSLNPATLVYKRRPVPSFRQKFFEGDAYLGYQVVEPGYIDSHLLGINLNFDSLLTVDKVVKEIHIEPGPDYKDGVRFRLDYNRFKEQVPLDTAGGKKYEGKAFAILDLAHRRLMYVCATNSSDCEVVAHYNGLVWLSLDGGSYTVPFFVDLETQQWYYLPEKALYTVMGDHWYHKSGRWRQAAEKRFIYREGESSMELLDL